MTGAGTTGAGTTGAGTTGALRVLVVHHQAVLADALAARLAREPGLDVVGAVGRPAPALALVPSRSVDVVVLDWCLPDGRSALLASQLLALDRPPALLALGEDERATAVIGALREGVHGWLAHTSPVAVLVEAVRTVGRGESWLPGRLLGPVLEHLLGERGRPEPSVLDVLTERERDVLRCMVAGLDQGAIAQQLFLSPNTVRTHRRRTLSKLGVHSSLEAVFLARSAGLAPQPVH